ncbi:hypothetical protein CKAH01_04595 [Colletotrichum kahawae]|uniref:Transmembrane protein n=1 Tax=Colletotrichum kahawae TaxID=34407 RepID=A0AAE0D761_COLKA|nr:hypothetical protein CKAH01_04595 [Colletotrichum kahawae]
MSMKEKPKSSPFPISSQLRFVVRPPVSFESSPSLFPEGQTVEFGSAPSLFETPSDNTQGPSLMFFLFLCDVFFLVADYVFLCVDVDIPRRDCKLRSW